MNAQPSFSPAPVVANSNRRSSGYTHSTLISMLADLEGAEGYYTYCGNRSSDTTIGHGRNDLPEHSRWIRAAVTRLRGLGVKVRISRCRGYLTVYGPKQGGRDGQYSC